MSKKQNIEVVMNITNAENLEKLMAKAIAEIVINRIDKLPDEIKEYAYNEVLRSLENSNSR
ncbi:hypothetical protein [Brassicibacter mesophilus]|uniref:hypothetical protein n=1 Tax=Brassicibacter mesophilus TaxID=745119 RepID=UPI003D25E3BA